MKEKSVASRYAQALFEIAEEKNSLAAFLDQWRLIAETIGSQEQAKTLFESRIFAKENKKELAKTLFAQSADPYVMEFLFLLIDKGRANYLEEILEAFQDLIDEKNGVLAVKIASALPLEENQKEELTAAIAKATGKIIKLAVSVDSALIGGLIMIINDTVYDGSIRGQLSLLKQQLTAGSDEVEH